jgi:phosphate transport system protein
MKEHTLKAFDEDLSELTRRLSEIGALAEQAVADASTALIKQDVELAAQVIARDTAIDLLQREIEEKVVLTIARRQLMAVDLREVVAALRVCNDLERVGDLAKNIAKRVSVLDSAGRLQNLTVGIKYMAERVLKQLNNVLDAYVFRDVEKALAVWRADENIDATCTSLFRDLLTYMMEDPRNVTLCIHLMFCAKNIERMGDHATNIAETVYYVAEGRPIVDERPKGDTTVFASLPAL